jgi:branched-chain amino acid transport system ATP-binding protein
VIAKKGAEEQRRLTILTAEQNFNPALNVADRGYVMVHGRIEFEGAPPR